MGAFEYAAVDAKLSDRHRERATALLQRSPWRQDGAPGGDDAAIT